MTTAYPEKTLCAKLNMPGETEAGYDLYALWSAVTTMTEETRLQGRAFKQLHDGLSPMQEMVGAIGTMLERYQAVVNQQESRWWRLQGRVQTRDQELGIRRLIALPALICASGRVRS